jgi:endonuclease G
MVVISVMTDNLVSEDLFVDDETIKRFQKKRSKMSETMKVFKTNKPGEILKLDSKDRVEKRKKHLSDNNLEDVTIERVIQKSDLMPIYYLERGRLTANSICRIEIVDDNGNTLGHGTGFMVSPSLLMTNNHVLPNKEDCKNSVAQFNYEKGEDFIDRPITSFKLDPEKFFYTNKKLDFSLVCVNPTSPDNKAVKDFGYLKLIKEQGKAVIGEYVSIIQHPRGHQKQVAIRENRIIDVFDDFVHYVTDTEPGSSGSSVLNDQWEVISLHHSGVPRKDAQGNYLTKDKKKWTRDMGVDKIDWIGNEGIRISSIVKHLESVMPEIPPSNKPILEEFLKLTN